MKINWGWGIAIFLTCFIGFILYFVIYSFGNKTDLEYEDYYAKELVHQEVIDATKNALPFAKNITISTNSTNILLTFPENFNKEIIEGTLTFFRPSDKNLDKIFDLKLNENKSQLFDNNLLESGFYNVIIEFKDKTKSYYLKKEINI